MSEPLLELRGIGKSYGSVQALTDVDLRVDPGEVVALVGDNGAGKSTLAKVISGAHQPDGGELLIEGHRQVVSSPAEGKRLGIEMVYQNLGLLENLSVAANMFLGREVRREIAGIRTPFMDVRTMTHRTKEMLDAQGRHTIPPRRSVAELSGGQRQLVAITRAAGWGSRLLVMDEPTAALGVRESMQVLRTIQGLRDRGISVLMISHNLEHVFALCDRIAVLRRGQNAGTVMTSETTPDEVVKLIVGAEAEAFRQVLASSPRGENR
jgi:ABC-type sugar transport system ATPase subunit